MKSTLKGIIIKSMDECVCERTVAVFLTFLPSLEHVYIGLYIGRFGSLSRDPNSTLGHGDTYKKTQLSSQSPSSYELKTDLSPVSEYEAEEIGTGTETETKVDLSMTEKLAKSETDAIPESSLVESSFKDKQKLISEERKDDQENTELKVVEGDVAVITNPAMASEVADKETTNPKGNEQKTQEQTQLKADTETDTVEAST